MSKKIITLNPQNCPKAVGPYSVAKVYFGVGYVSGQIPINPQTNEVLSSTIQAQTQLIMQNMGNILKAMKCGYEHILKCSIFLTDMTDFPKVNQVYGKYFKQNMPARYCIAVKQLPKNCRIEIDATVAAINHLQ